MSKKKKKIMTPKTISGEWEREFESKWYRTPTYHGFMDVSAISKCPNDIKHINKEAVKLFIKTILSRQQQKMKGQTRRIWYMRGFEDGRSRLKELRERIEKEIKSPKEIDSERTLREEVGWLPQHEYPVKYELGFRYALDRVLSFIKEME